MQNLLTKSESFKEEYCCSVVRIPELVPVEGSDFLAKCNILGTQIVVRKDSMSTGDVMFYSANETALNEKFLSVNNLFEIGCREKNSNADEVNAIMKEYDDNYRKEADELRSKAKDTKSRINSLTTSAARYNKQIKKLQEELDNINDGKIVPTEGRVEEIKEEIKEKQNKADNNTAKATSLTVEYTNAKRRVEELVNAGKHIVDEAKKCCGYFNKYGRVRCITLKGEPSFGFLFSVSEMIKYCPEISKMNLDELVGEDFDTVNGELFVKAYIPPIKTDNKKKTKNQKRQNKIKRFDRIVDGEFEFHYDTRKLERNMHLLNPDTEVTISVKIHGTSVIISKLHVKEPKRIAPHKWLWNKFVDLTGWFRKTRFIDYDLVYGPIFSSRTVIKNRYINQNVNSGFYSKDIWSEYGEIIYPYLEDGMSVYAEIFGYITDGHQMIQKHYDYGCNEGENKIMFYRMVTINPDGTKREWEVDEVREWTEELIKKMKENNDENYKKIHVIDILYKGTLGELYPEIDPSEHWHEEVLNKLKDDKKNFGLEELEPLCTNFESPREGICVRITNDSEPSCYKLKCDSFKLREALLMDAGEVDMEMLDNYGDIAVQEEK